VKVREIRVYRSSGGVMLVVREQWSESESWCLQAERCRTKSEELRQVKVQWEKELRKVGQVGVECEQLYDRRRNPYKGKGIEGNRFLSCALEKLQLAEFPQAADSKHGCLAAVNWPNSSRRVDFKGGSVSEFDRSFLAF
jgi:hypothetical protein